MTGRRLLFHIPAMVGGGAERVVAVLATSFADSGDQVTLAVETESHEQDAFLESAITVVAIGKDHALGVVRLAKLIRASKPDLIVGALGSANLKVTLAAILAGWRRRVVITFHGAASDEPKRLSQMAYRALPWLSRITPATIAVSEGLKTHLVKDCGAYEPRVVAIHNPIRSFLSAPPTAAELQAREPIILAIGRLVPAKNFEFLIDAFARVQHPGARLIILGEGPKRPMIEAAIVRHGVEDRVKLMGYVTEPWNFYRQARCFALSSSSEAFGNVIVEALAAGLSVVATDCPGPMEILAGNTFGQIVPCGDAAAMARALDAALTDTSDPMIRAARAADFSPEAARDRYRAVFDKVIAEAG
jgi:glycosyltransferase involved in cell wall biosynthesis